VVGSTIPTCTEAISCSMTTTNTEKAIGADPSKGVKVNAAVIAQPFRDEIKERVQQLKNHGIGTFVRRRRVLPEFLDNRGRVS